MSRSSSKAVVPPPPPGIVDLRRMILQAEGEGARREDMVLRLTFRDAALMKRSREIGVDEIRFSNGEMRFLDVRVVVGDVKASDLEVA